MSRKIRVNMECPKCKWGGTVTLRTKGETKYCPACKTELKKVPTIHRNT